MEIISQIIDTTINSFDFGYCIIVNVLTYLVIKLVDELNKEKEVTVWMKRVILLGCILSTGVVYYLLGQDVKLLINSAILAPVSWDIIFRPLCKRLGINYKQVNKTMPK
jgi:hypothetical protein